jgi:dihydrofolate reductase
MAQSTIQNPKSKISIIAAMSENRVIGRNNQLPWHMPADLARFKRLTTGHHVIMGRRTFESMGKPLPNRTNIVITRRRDWRAEGVIVMHELDQAIDAADGEDEVFVLGGADVFRLTMPYARRIYLTLIHAHIEGDTFFPEIDPQQWKLVSDEGHQADQKNRYPYSFQQYERSEKLKA